MLSIPLKVPHPCELQTELTLWINRHSGTSTGPDFTAEECRDDLVRLASLRRAVTNAISHANGHESVTESIDDCHEYHAVLLQCENRRLTGIEANAMQSDHQSMELEWDGAFSPPSNVHHTLLWERACMLWNMCAAEAYSATNQKSSSIASVKGSIGHWRMAASLMKSLHELVEKHNLYSVTVDFSRPMLLFWEHIMIAQAQMSTYEFSIVKTARPSHPALARLAAGTVPVLQECLKLCRDPLLTSHLPTQTQTWSGHCKTLTIWFKGKSEYHEACASRSKSQWGMEVARIQRACATIEECQRFFQRLPGIPSSLLGFGSQLDQLLLEIRDRLEIAQHENNTIRHDAVPTNLPEIRGQLLVKADSEIPETMTTPSVPLFHRLRKRTERDLVLRFTKSMAELVEQMTALVHQQTEGAREELSRVNLPHSLIAYKQEQSGGGIPQDLWVRVEEIQRKAQMKQLKQDLWQLRDVADAARDIANQVKRQLDEDVEMDRLFREVFVNFNGHDVGSVQTEARAALAEYENLLAKSQAGDTVLLKRLEFLDTDPKYQLLQYNKSKLDRLLPSSSASSRYSTRRLSEMLADLSQLFDEREATLAKLRDLVERSSARSNMQSGDESSSFSSQHSHRALREARNDAQAISYDIQLNVDRQADLLDSILAENEEFMQVRRSVGAPNSSGDSVLAMIDDAVEDVDFFSKHLKEGHNFYNIVTPKLEQLKQQVGDISVRLTVERCEHEEEARYGDRRRKQEITGGLMSSGSRGVGGRHSHASPTSSMSGTDSRYASAMGRDVMSSEGSVPGVESLSHSTPQTRVDDKKAASLIAMDFNADEVVDALKRHDNNFEQALNELLQG